MYYSDENVDPVWAVYMVDRSYKQQKPVVCQLLLLK